VSNGTHFQRGFLAFPNDPEVALLEPEVALLEPEVALLEPEVALLEP
jgi:hypothetical protein